MSQEHRLYYYRARLFELFRRPHDAARHYRKALAVKPDFAPALIALAVLYASIQQYPSAESCMEKLVQREPDNADWLFDLGFIYEKQRRYDEAIEAFRKSVRINPNIDRAWYGMGLAYSAQRKYEEAIKAFEKATKLQPWAPHPWYELAMSHHALDHNDKVREILRHLSGFDPKMTAQLERHTGIKTQNPR